MRIALAAIVLALAGCPSVAPEANTLDDGFGAGSGSGQAGGPAQCAVAADCAPAGARCCDCPTHAVPTYDPAFGACVDVDCSPATCGSPREADCRDGACVLVCSPVTCDVTCATGYSTDSNGCLVCSCAVASIGECSIDSDCTRTRADCCGCAMGGEDTAVPNALVAAYEGQLMCPTNPTCPGGDTCSPDLAARCVQGTCALVDGSLPANACGRLDLPACPADETCTLNANDQASMHGVGVCLPPP